MLRKTTFALGLLTASSISQAAIQISQVPLFLSQSAPPLNMLVMSRDHTLYYEAYNDASDLDGDGVIDVGYKPDQIDYYGYFNSNVCYDYTGGTGSATSQAAAGGRFVPKSRAGGSNGKQCSGSWSGDFLNYLTTSRMDAMRRVLYGGQRTEDTTSRTVLEAAYIPRDGHAWGKSYDRSRDTYDINHYAPSLGNPGSNKRHLFAVTTMGVEASNRTQLRVLKDTDWQIWDWVSRESTNGQGGEKCGSANQTASNGKSGVHNCGTTVGYNIRVEACTGVDSQLRNDNCKAYPGNNNQPIHKPTGLLHDFGESEDMFFGLLTGSYQNNISGGTLRRNISSFADEVDSRTGQFTNVNGIVANINRLKVIDFNNSNYYTGCNWDSAYKANPIDYSGGNSADCAMWGNPVAEMMFETMRYFAGASGAHSLYDYGSGTSKDKTHDLAKPTWQPPYAASNDGGGGYQYCARPVMTVLSDINPSYDYKLPGSRYQSIAANASALSSFNVSSEVDAIGSSEGIHGNDYFIGQSASGNADDAPTPKTINALSWARGLAPEEPSKRGTYYSAGVARYGAMNKIAGTSAGKNELMTYAVALASPLPQIRIPVGSGHVTVVPFAKSVKSSTNPAIDINKFVPTNPIVDYYVVSIANTGDADRDTSINGGLPYAKFIINYEDMEVGSDHDMDAIAEYTVALQEGGVKVDVETTFKAGSTVQHMGYVIAGTTNDGIYIEIQDSNRNNVFYPLNTPANRDPGWCEGRSNDNSCRNLPLSASRTFTPSPSGSTGEFLRDPLWYAAKYGMPGRSPASVAGDPDNYFLVTNATTLQSQLTKAFNDILQRNNSITSPVVEGNTTEDGTFIYRTDFKADGWTGDLFKEQLVVQADGSSQRETIWRASTELPAKGSRNILFAPASGQGSLEPFTWQSLKDREFAGTDLQIALNKHANGTSDNLGEARVKYILEASCGADCADFRERKSRLGDIINSSPVLVEGAQYLPYRAETLDGAAGSYRGFQQQISSRPGMIYVGANDGMLHAFNSETGKEEFAFIPSAVISNLNKLTDPQYGSDTADDTAVHQYFVDGTPVVSDVYYDGQWHTVLLGSLGAGGKSVFALNVTDPTRPELLWEFSNADDAAMGVSIPQPTIARLHSGQWAALVPNGYNSASGPALFILDIQTGKQIAKLAPPTDPDAPFSAGNGLSNIRTADMNGDGIVDYVYAGDQLGSLWRFDLYNAINGSFNKCTSNCAGISTQYAVSFGGKPLYVARDENGQPLPITAAPTLIRHPSSIGHLVLIGTGRYLGFPDKDSSKLESVYGIWDRQTNGPSAATTPTLDRSKLQAQSMSAETMQVAGESRTVRLISENAIQWYKSGADDTSEANVEQWGWRLDLSTSDTPTGERVVNDMRIYGEGLLFSTITPSADPCSAGLDGFTYAINPATGGRTPYNVFDFSGDGQVNTDDSLDGEVVSGFENPAGDFTIHDGFLYSPDGERIAVDHGSLAQGRQSWRLIPRAE